MGCVCQARQVTGRQEQPASERPRRGLKVKVTGPSAAAERWRSAEDTAWSGRCRTTRWSVVFAAAAGGAAARTALAQLYRAYWYPVFAVLAKRCGPQAAAELTQAFFVERLVDQGDLKRVRPRPGERFRGWLFTAARRFLLTELQFERRQRRDVRRAVAFVNDPESDEHGPRVCAIADPKLDPEEQLGREQALELLSTVLHRLRREYCAHAASAGVDGALRFDALKVFLPGRDTESAKYEAVSVALGLDAGNIKRLVRQLRKRFGALLHEELAKRVSSDRDLASAKRMLCQSLVTRGEP